MDLEELKCETNGLVLSVNNKVKQRKASRLSDHLSHRDPYYLIIKLDSIVYSFLTIIFL